MCLTLVIGTMVNIATARAGDLRQADDVAELCALGETWQGLVAHDPRDSVKDPVLASLERRARVFSFAEHMVDTYRVKIAPSAFHVVERHPQTGQLVIGAYEPLPLFDGRHALALSQNTIALGTSPDTMEQLEIGHDAGLVVLQVTFQLRAVRESQRHFCRRDNDRAPILVDGDLLKAQLIHLGTGDVLATMTSDHDQTRRVRMDLLGELASRRVVPRAELTKVECISDPTRAHVTLSGVDEADCLEATEHRWLKAEIESALMICYVQGLKQRGKYQGALTFRLRINEEGQLHKPHVIIDALAWEVFTACALDRLRRPKLPALGRLMESQLSVVTIFGLDLR